MTLASSDNYDGATFVNQAILNIQHGNALGLTAATTTVLDGAQPQIQGGITVQNQLLHISGTGVFGTGALESVGGNNHWVGAVTLSKDPAFAPPTVAPNNVAIGVLDTGPNDRLTIDGVINQPLTQTMGLTKVGPGMLVLNNNTNSYGGVTTVAAGVLRIQKPHAQGSAGAPPGNGTVVNAGAALELDGDPNGTGASFTVVSETL